MGIEKNSFDTYSYINCTIFTKYFTEKKKMNIETNNESKERKRYTK